MAELTDIRKSLNPQSDSLAPPSQQLDLEKHHEGAEKQHNKENPRKDLPPWKWALVLLGLFLGAFLYGLDTTIASDVQASVYESLGHIENLSWIGMGFPLASVAVILLVGRAYDIFNIKFLLIGGIVVFEIGSAVCGAAPRTDALIVGRVIAGIGGALMYIGALTHITVFASAKEAALYNALIGLSWGVGAVSGPAIGGAFSGSKATWRWAFYINLPLAGVLSPVYLFIFPSYDPRPDLPTLSKLATIDWFGAFCNAVVQVAFMSVVTFEGSTFSWNSGELIALWVVFGVSLIAFICQQSFATFTSSEHQIFPIHFLKSRTMVLLYTATAGSAAANAITLYYIPLFFQFTRNDTALIAAVRLLPFITVFIFFVMLAGGLLPVIGRYTPLYIIGGALVVAGGALMFSMDQNTSVARVYGYEALIGAGSGLTFQNAYAVTAARVSSADKGNTVGFINVAQIGTIAISLSIAGSLFQNLGFTALKEALAPFHLPEQLVRSALAGTLSPIFSGSGSSHIAQLAVQTVAETIRRVFGTVIAAGAVIFLSGAFLPFEKLEFERIGRG